MASWTTITTTIEDAQDRDGNTWHEAAVNYGIGMAVRGGCSEPRSRETIVEPWAKGQVRRITTVRYDK